MKGVDKRMEKYISIDILCDLAEVVLKSNSFKIGEKTLNQKRGSAIGTKIAPRYSILFMAELEEEILRKAEFITFVTFLSSFSMQKEHTIQRGTKA